MVKREVWHWGKRTFLLPLVVFPSLPIEMKISAWASAPLAALWKEYIPIGLDKS